MSLCMLQLHGQLMAGNTGSQAGSPDIQVTVHELMRQHATEFCNNNSALLSSSMSNQSAVVVKIEPRQRLFPA